MKIIMIRHAKVDIKWEEKYTSAGYDSASAAYDAAPIVPVEEERFDAGDRIVYVSALPRTAATARGLFGEDAELKIDADLNEVPRRSCRDTDRMRSRRYWDLMGRLQWFLGSPRQEETRRDTIRRADAVLDRIEREPKDVIVVSHGFFLLTLIARLKKRGYVITKGSLFLIGNLERVRATKREDHCGACNRNCLLTSPGCGVGIDTARREGSL